MSEALREDIARWAAHFDKARSEQNSGPADFESQLAAEDFVRRGRELVVSLQGALGDDWHVEYMPTPTRLPPNH